ncbi:hypothetical protein HO675_08875 [Streptococcus suis]|nr:hypothetical protein [Streptococcus suis]
MKRATFDDYLTFDDDGSIREGELLSQTETNVIDENHLELKLDDLSLKKLVIEVISNQTILRNKVEDLLDLQEQNSIASNRSEPVESLKLAQNEQLSDIEQKLSQLLGSAINTQQNFAKLLRIQEINSKLHDELSMYKSGLFEEIKLPIFRSIWRVRKNIVEELNSYKQKEGDENQIFVQVLEDVVEDIDELLENNQLRIFTSAIGEVFNSVFSKKYNEVDTSHRELHLKVARVRDSGLEKDGIIIEKQVVDVYKYVETVSEVK